jgi:GNAT superfamily N-acetyltransferase
MHVAISPPLARARRNRKREDAASRHHAVPRAGAAHAATIASMQPRETAEAIERATLAAVPPQRQQEWRGWLLAFDDGTVGRAKSAVPLQHDVPQAGAIEEIERRYGQEGLQPVLRVPEFDAFGAMREELRERGYVRAKPTLVQLAGVSGFGSALTRTYGVRLEATPSEEWEHVFLGEGFDPVDGASRLAILRRARESVFASAREDGRTVAVGSACFSGGWCGVHGMRTLASHRGRGLASAVLRALGGAARERGIERCFLQVEEANGAARSLYAGLGFRTAWAYAYWKRP